MRSDYPIDLASIRADFDVTCYSGATRKQSELDYLFNLVAPKDNWKNPIDARVPVETIAATGITALRDAIVHFVGSDPDVTHDDAAGIVRFTAPGYYVTIGA